MNDAKPRAELIEPALLDADWGVVAASLVHSEEYITLGRLQGAGQRGNADIAGYFVVHRDRWLAVIEAKKRVVAG